MERPSQRKKLKDKKREVQSEEIERAMWEQDIREACADVRVRRVLWKILGKCKMLQNVGEEKTMHTERNIGKQNIGHWLVAEILASDENIFFKMMTESKKGVYEYGNKRTAG